MKNCDLLKVISVATVWPLFAECGVWNYRPYEYEAWTLKQMLAEHDRGVLQVSYHGTYLTLTNEPAAFYSETPVAGCEPIPGSPGIPPHRRPRPEVVMTPTLKNGIYDLGHEDIGYVRVSSYMRPTLFVGESLAEVNSSDYGGFEQSTLMVPDGPGRWRSDIPLAGRYLRFQTKVDSVRFGSQVDWSLKPAVRFSLDDKRLEGIWNAGVETLRLCMRTLMVDAIKRDRLPWSADMVVGLLANADSFRYPEPIKRTLAALGSADPAQGGHVNGVAAYSAWWVVGQDLLQRKFGEPDYLKLHYPRIVARMDEMETHCDERGFMTKNLGWNFMDWTDDAGGKVRSEVSLQCIYYWALQSAVHLATLSGDAEHAQAWSERAAKLRANIHRAGMDGTRHARILAIVSGAYEGPDAEKLARELAEGDFEPTKTPYMATFEVMALARGGQMKAAWRKFESVWGAMYDAGERTCWEWWDPSKTGDARYLFYRRPFGNALCHQWSSGVVHLLSSVLK